MVSRTPSLGRRILEVHLQLVRQLQGPGGVGPTDRQDASQRQTGYEMEEAVRVILSLF